MVSNDARSWSGAFLFFDVFRWRLALDCSFSPGATGDFLFFVLLFADPVIADVSALEMTLGSTDALPLVDTS